MNEPTTDELNRLGSMLEAAGVDLEHAEDCERKATAYRIACESAFDQVRYAYNDLTRLLRREGLLGDI